MAYLADVNVLFAIIVKDHQHCGLANKWLSGIQSSSQIGVCRVTQMGLLRLLTRRTVMGDGLLSAVEAWNIVNVMMSDDRFFWVDDTIQVNLAWSEIIGGLGGQETPNTDTYLAALATASGLTLATLDSSFKRFPHLKLWLLA